MIDMDPQGNLSSAAGVNGQAKGSVADSLLDRKVALPIHRVVQRMDSILDLVPANINLAATEAALMNKLGRELRLRDQLVAISNDYDFVLIDTPPSLGLLTINSLVAADKVLIPTEARLFSLQGLQMLQESIEEILYLNPRLQVLGILLSKLDRRLKEERLVSGYLRDRWGAQVFQTEVGTNSKILEAASSGFLGVQLLRGREGRGQLSGPGAGGDQTWLKYEADLTPSVSSCPPGSIPW